MCSIPIIAYRSLAGLAVGCSLLALACGNSSKPQSGMGGAGSGGLSATGGAAQPGATTGLGGTTTATISTQTGSGGVGTTAATSSAAGGSGGSTVVTGTDAGQPASGGRTGAGGATSTGGTSGGSGGGGATTANLDGGASPDAAASGGDGSGGGSGSSGAVPSDGCGKTPPASDRYTISVGGTSREYILKVPDNYDPNHPYRLIFGFHGAKYSDDWVATGKAPDGGTPLSGPYFGIESESAGGAIFVAPQANPTWGTGDLTFVDTMLAQFEDQLCIDKSRIFSVGFSMGAIMTINIACNRSEVFRGVAPMSGSLPTPCPSGQPIAYWASHGTNDPTISITLGQAARDEFVTRNHCGTQTSDPDANNCITYQGCDQGYPVTWCTFDGVHDPAPFAGPGIWKFIEPL